MTLSFCKGDKEQCLWGGKCCVGECLTLCVSLAMEAPYDGTEVTVVMEEIEDTYTYTSPVPSKKKKKYKSPGDHGEKAKKPR